MYIHLIDSTLCENKYLFRLNDRQKVYFTITEISGIGVSTVAGITDDVCEGIINNLWNDSVVNNFLTNEQTLREKDA